MYIYNPPSDQLQFRFKVEEFSDFFRHRLFNSLEKEQEQGCMLLPKLLRVGSHV